MSRVLQVAWRALNRLVVVAFVAGFTLMVYELAAARILAPTIGSSMYVWTSVIGVIIAALSLGFWVGGRVADRRARELDIARLSLLAALTITLTLILYPGVLEWVSDNFTDQRAAGVVASLLLFAPTSFSLGMISPYLAKLNVRSLENSGQSVANLSVFDALGGISGTFITGFVLFGYIGSRETIFLTVILMVVVSWLLVPKQLLWRRAAFSAVIIIIAMLTVFQRSEVIQIDTATSHYSIFNVSRDGQLIRGITAGPSGLQSGLAIAEPDELAFWYTQQMADIVAAAPAQNDILILGGGALTLPQYLATEYPEAQIDVVEIDPELLAIAREYFNYRDPGNVTFFAQDARAFVNTAQQQYDVVLVDAFSDISVPQNMVTVEYGEALAEIVRGDGVVAVNSIAGLEGACRELFNALSAPYAASFDYASYQVDRPNAATSNIVSIHSRTPFVIGGYTPYPYEGPRYTDNFIPSERLEFACSEQRRS